MKIFRRLIYKEVISAVTFVSLGFLALFFFFDLLDEMRSVGRAPGYTLGYALMAVAFEIPNHLYELLPITVLIGTIFVMARLAQSSEFTIMRTSGLGPWRALGTMVLLGLGFVLFTGFLGDYVAPAAQRLALQAQAKYLGSSKSTGSTGAWLKERSADGHMLAVNIRAIDANGRLGPVRIFAFDAAGRLHEQLHASDGQVHAETGIWELNAVQHSQFSYDSAGEMAQVKREQLPNFSFYTNITGDMALAERVRSHVNAVRTA